MKTIELIPQEWYLFKEYDGIAEIDIDEYYASMDIISPRMFNDKITLRELSMDFNDEDDERTIN